MRGLYAIADSAYTEAADLESCCQAVLDAGCRILQYRDKNSDSQHRLERARVLQTLCRRYQAELIINDDLEVAAELQCGLHLGADDADLASARQQLGPQAIIGASCYNQLDLAQQAQTNGASYIAFGAFFSSPTKPAAVVAQPDLLSQARKLELPIVAIGGITPDNGAPLVAAGADMLAVISGLWQAANLRQQVQAYQRLF